MSYNQKFFFEDFEANHRKVVFLVDKTSNVDVVYKLDQGLLRRKPVRNLFREPRPNAKHSLYRYANERLDDHREEGEEMGI